MEGTYTDVGYEKRVEYHGELADDLLTGDPDFAGIAALAAEGVQAGEVDGEALARRFHETYERLAPSFGYETRTETREFDPESANGRLMIAVCASLSQQPEARGVVDGRVVDAFKAVGEWGGPNLAAALSRALTGERNG